MDKGETTVHELTELLYIYSDPIYNPLRFPLSLLKLNRMRGYLNPGLHVGDRFSID